MNGAGEGIRTLDIHLGKVVLYQLSYARESLLISFDHSNNQVYIFLTVINFYQIFWFYLTKKLFSLPLKIFL